LKSPEVISKLTSNGFELRGVKGSHHQFKHAHGRLVTKESRFPAPKKRKAAALDGIDFKVAHPVKDIPIGTLRNIFRIAGWQWKPIE